MKLIDTHTHIYLEDFDADRSATIDAARVSGIAAVLLPNIDSGTIEPLFRLCDAEPDFAFPMMGLHPTSVNKSYASELKQIEKQLIRRTYYGIGEIGIDLYWDRACLKEQVIVFEEQLKWSIDMQLAVSIHTRDAFPEVFNSIHKVGADKLKGVFHCFTGGKDELDEVLKMSRFKIGINGVVTFKKSPLPELLAAVPLDRVVLETDAPYLAPVPYRGKRNEPAYILETAKKVAEIYRTDVGEVAAQTSKNTEVLFGLLREGVKNEHV